MARSIDDELSRQRDTLLAAGVPALAGTSETTFAQHVEALRELANTTLASGTEPAGPGHVPFVIVTGPGIVDARALMPLTRLSGRTRPGIVDRHHGDDDLGRYRPIPPIELPDVPVYLLTDVERGDEFRGMPPEDALPAILGRGRTPLTIHEGIAVILHAPELLIANHCFMLAGSRRGDRRVPGLWISSGAPKLGWCWDGNPHDWLGVASAAQRLGPVGSASTQPSATAVVHATGRG